MSGAASVVARELGDEGDKPVLVRGVESAVEGVVDVGGVIVVSGTLGDHARVDAREVSVPEVDVEVVDYRAGVDVDELQIEVEVETRL